MVRIKQTTFRNAVAAKVPKKRIAKRISTKSDSMIRGTTAAPDPKRKAGKRKTKPYEKINREIKRLQMSTDLILPKAAFKKLCQEILQDLPNAEGGYRFGADAIEMLQEMSESVLVGLFKDSDLCKSHAKRKTLNKEDMQLANYLTTTVKDY